MNEGAEECGSSIYGAKGDDVELSDVELNDVVNDVWCNK